MIMNLEEKIQSIRKKPEHIRLRYIWFSVSICMFLVITLWIISLKAGKVSQKNDLNTTSPTSLEEMIEGK